MTAHCESNSPVLLNKLFQNLLQYLSLTAFLFYSLHRSPVLLEAFPLPESKLAGQLGATSGVLIPICRGPAPPPVGYRGVAATFMKDGAAVVALFPLRGQERKLAVTRNLTSPVRNHPHHGPTAQPDSRKNIF